MSKYSTGSYLITYLGKVGDKLGTVPTESFIKGIDDGSKLVEDGIAHSFVVSRALYNSLESDIDQKWIPKDSFPYGKI